MKHNSTLFLKIVIIFFSMAILALCILITDTLITKDAGDYSPILIGMLIAAVPYFLGAHQSFMLLNTIDQKKTFSAFSVNALRKIKYCCIAISALYSGGLPYIFHVAERDDAPGVVLLGLIFAFAPMIVAVIAGVIQKLFQDAIDLKSENDLTV